jgi:hypothetical protein
MPAEAEIVHQVPGRLRLRVAGHTGDRKFFEQLQVSLRGCPGIQQLAINPYSGSVLILHESNADTIMEYGRTHNLFAPPAHTKRSAAPPSSAAIQTFQRLDSQLRERTAGNWDLRELAFLVLSIGGMVQTARQNFLPAGFTLFWYASGLLQQKLRRNNWQT